MKEKNYNKQIIEVLSQPFALGGLTSKVIASHINKDEAFTRVYLNRLSKVRPGKKPKIEKIPEKRGKFNIYHISARTKDGFRIEILTRELKEEKDKLKILEEALQYFTKKNQELKIQIQELNIKKN